MSRKTALPILLCVLLGLSVVYGWRQTTLAESYRQQVASGYRKSLYETMELVESMRVNLAKLQVTASSTNRRKLLAELALYAEGAQADMASLPDDMPFSAGALKFLNQVADFSVSSLDAESMDENTVDSLLNASISLYDELKTYSERLDAGEIVFQSDGSQPQADPQDLTQVTTKYPSLLYDGPFSDHRQTAPVSLPGEEMTLEQAAEALRHYLGDRAREITFVMESQIMSACYEFDVQTAEGLLSVAVTKQGGHVVYMVCDREPTRRVFSVGECVDFAASFLAQRGYADMRVSYWQVNDAMVTVNFAASQNGVILYPDLIKVDVSMESGSILGVEARNYLSNHRDRSIPDPLLTPGQAQAYLHRNLTPVNTRLCVIPDTGSEIFCYEISAVKNETTYLIYINAMTGEEVEVLQVMETEKGQLAV